MKAFQDLPVAVRHSGVLAVMSVLLALHGAVSCWSPLF